MKRCPQCSQVYEDDMRFCLSDGTPLVALLDEPDEATVVRTAKTTSFSGSELWVKILIAGLVLFFGFVIFAGVAAWIFWPRDVLVVSNGNNSNVPTSTPTRTPVPSPTRTVDANGNQSNLTSQQEELERERRRLEEERRRLEEEKRRPPTTPASPPKFNDPPTTRVTFRRGSVGETVSGTVGRQRTFVLRTMNGQHLSATVSSPGGCVLFTDGGPNVGYTTRSGDSYLYLRNTCGEPSRFSLSINVR